MTPAQDSSDDEDMVAGNTGSRVKNNLIPMMAAKEGKGKLKGR
jgi:hypothetical protein